MRTLLLDGDMYAFRTAAAEQKQHTFDGVNYFFTADADQGKANMDAMIETHMRLLNASNVVVALTHAENFRKDVLPSYKSNRKDVVKPLILNALKDHLRGSYDTIERPGLEADDVLGILATHPKQIPGEKVICTWDKDLLTVPGLHWNPEKGWKEAAGEQVPVVVQVSEREADEAFYAQALSGDAVDGYGGCPGIGKARAAQIVGEGRAVERVEEPIKRGPRAGETRVRWVAYTCNDIWECIVSHYRKAGLGEAEALATARVARILRHSDYDLKNREVRLWKPPHR